MLCTTYISHDPITRQQQPLPYEMPKTNTLIDCRQKRVAHSVHSNVSSQLLRVTVVDVCYPSSRSVSVSLYGWISGLVTLIVRFMPWKLPFSDVFFRSSSVCRFDSKFQDSFFHLSRLSVFFKQHNYLVKEPSALSSHKIFLTVIQSDKARRVLLIANLKLRRKFARVLSASRSRRVS